MGARTAVDLVAVRAAIYRIVSCITEESVSTVTNGNIIVASTTERDVIAGTG
jgi:hypothetical protein